MITDKVLTDGLINLRCLDLDDITMDYLAWLRDTRINRYLEIRHALPATLEDLIRFVQSINQSEDSIIFGMFLSDGAHIGNIKLGPINSLHSHAEIGLIIGDSKQWGKGYASRAIRIITEFGFTQLRLFHLTAGCYKNNQGSFRAFLKAGYQHEGTLVKHWQSDGERVDGLLLGISRGHDERC